MSVSLAEIFRREPDLGSFRRAVLSLAGDFPFTNDDMIALGEAYFERFPDRAQDRNAAEVLLGYALVRVALIEKAVLAVDPGRRGAYRAMLNDVARVGPELEALRAVAEPSVLQADQASLQAALAGLKRGIDDLPKGLVKERFVGGISNLFNIMYVLQMRLRGPLQGPPDLLS
jgi:hypothetical protein